MLIPKKWKCTENYSHQNADSSHPYFRSSDSLDWGNFECPSFLLSVRESSDSALCGEETQKER